MTKTETITEMLKRFHEARETLDGKDGSPKSGERVPLMPVTWNDSYRQLERLLIKLRVERTSQHWHVSERYLRCTIRVIEAPTRKTKSGNVEILLPAHTELVAGSPVIGGTTARCRVRQWSPRVREEKVRRGVSWLAENYQGEPYMPVEFLAAA